MSQFRAFNIICWHLRTIYGAIWYFFELLWHLMVILWRIHFHDHSELGQKLPSTCDRSASLYAKREHIIRHAQRFHVTRSVESSTRKAKEVDGSHGSRVQEVMSHNPISLVSPGFTTSIMLMERETNRRTNGEDKG